MIYTNHQHEEYFEDIHDFLTTQSQMESNEVNEKLPLQMESSFGTETPMCQNRSLPMLQTEYIQTLSFWMEVVFQFTIGIVGIISNLLAIPILCSPSIKSVFNKLLICLLILHTVYISSVLLIEAIMWEVWKSESDTRIDAWNIILFSFILHPLKQLMLYSSTFITVLMARQRFLAIRHPITYRNSILSSNPWIPAIKSLIVVLMTAALFTFPLFLETSVEGKVNGRVYDVNSTHFQYVSFLCS